MKPDICAGILDDGESVSLMEPLIISSDAEGMEELRDLALTLVAESAAFKSSLSAGIVEPLADLVRSMNCYYSNLIEGHDTHPIDIERALKNDYSADNIKRDLQLEAKAHITVQKWIDEGNLSGRALKESGIKEIHERFTKLLPEKLRHCVDSRTQELLEVVAGQYRNQFVQVGRHVAISAGAVARFMERFEQAYARLGKLDSIIACAAAHHRLLWIHPFLDGNGRVARLSSYAHLLDRLDTGGVWSIARGLARRDAEYKSQLIACDQRRYNDLDGRGNLSQSSLIKFTKFFLETCIDQVKFMRGLVQPDKLRHRIVAWADEEAVTDKSFGKIKLILEAVLYRGELPRSDVPELLGVTDRQARRIVSHLLERGVLCSKSDRTPLRLAFSIELASRWMPGLFPEKY